MSKKPATNISELTLRPEWMRAPSWRWGLAQSFLADPTKPLSLANKDQYLGQAAKFYKDRKQYARDPKIFAKKHPALTEAFEIYCDNRAGGWRWYIEALMMTGLDSKALAKELKVKCSPESIEMYRKLFFDISGYRESQIAVYANVLSTSRACITDFSNYDYTWKLFAYCWGPEAFIEQFCFKDTNPNVKYKEWFKSFAQNNVTINAFHLSHDLKMTYNMQALEVIKTAQTFWTIPQKAVDDAEKLVTEDVVSGLIGHIDMQLMRADMKIGGLDKKEYADFKFA